MPLKFPVALPHVLLEFPWPPPNRPNRCHLSTYMFTYSDAQPFRPSLVDMFEEYWRRLPQYQGLTEEAVEQLRFKRLLFAFFPTYKNSPLPPAFDRCGGGCGEGCALNSLSAVWA
jgi:hypothetical protein